MPVRLPAAKRASEVSPQRIGLGEKGHVVIVEPGRERFVRAYVIDTERGQVTTVIEDEAASVTMLLFTPNLERRQGLYTYLTYGSGPALSGPKPSGPSPGGDPDPYLVPELIEQAREIAKAQPR